MANLAQLKQYRNNPDVRKFLDLLSYTEGTQGNGYYTAFGGGRLAHLNDHPRYLKSFRQTNGKMNKTSAAGRYQFVRPTWDGLAKQYGFKDFGAENQDLGAIALLVQAGAMPHILKGDFKNAIAKAGGTWASLPTSPHPQPTKSWAKVNAFLSNYQPKPILGNHQPAPMQAPRTQADRVNNMLMVAQMGDYRLGGTGIGTGDHYDLRLPRNKDGTRGDVNPYLDRFYVNGRGLNTYRQTGKFMEQRKGYRHGGVDFGFNGSFGGNKNARNLYIAPEWQERISNVQAFYDKKGGGHYTQVTFDDGIKVNILHQNKQGTQNVMSAWGQRRKPQVPSYQPKTYSPDEIVKMRSVASQPSVYQPKTYSPDEIMRMRSGVSQSPNYTPKTYSPDEIVKMRGLS